RTRRQPGPDAVTQRDDGSHGLMGRISPLAGVGVRSRGLTRTAGFIRGRLVPRLLGGRDRMRIIVHDMRNQENDHFGLSRVGDVPAEQTPQQRQVTQNRKTLSLFRLHFLDQAADYQRLAVPHPHHRVHFARPNVREPEPIRQVFVHMADFSRDLHRDHSVFGYRSRNIELHADLDVLDALGDVACFVHSLQHNAYAVPDEDLGRLALDGGNPGAGEYLGKTRLPQRSQLTFQRQRVESQHERIATQGRAGQVTAPIDTEFSQRPCFNLLYTSLDDNLPPGRVHPAHEVLDRKSVVEG